MSFHDMKPPPIGSVWLAYDGKTRLVVIKQPYKNIHDNRLFVPCAVFNDSMMKTSDMPYRDLHEFWAANWRVA